MPKVNITSTEQKTSKAGKTYYVVTLDDGSKAVSWDASIMGKTGEIEAEIIEKYDDLGNLRRTLKLPGTGERKFWGGKTPEQEKKISKHVAFKGAIEIGVSRNLDDDEILRLAEMYFEWLEK